ARGDRPDRGGAPVDDARWCMSERELVSDPVVVAPPTPVSCVSSVSSPATRSITTPVVGQAPSVPARRVAVFAGAAPGHHLHFRSLAVGLGHALACRHLEVVIGAGVSGGLMGTVADAARLAGARVLGVVPRGLWSAAAIHPDADELHTTPDLAQRLL